MTKSGSTLFAKAGYSWVQQDKGKSIADSKTRIKEERVSVIYSPEIKKSAR